MGKIKTFQERQQEREDAKRYSIGNIIYDTRKLCLIYARQSSSKQYVSNVYSALEQSEGLQDRARALGWERDEQWILYCENQLSKKLRVSGSLRIDQRVGLSWIAEVIASDQASAVLVVSVDRITRDEDLITPTAFANLCKDHHVLLVCDDYTFDFNNPTRDDMGRFMNEAIAAKEYVRKQIKGKMLKGRTKKASMGRVANGACPIGLTLDAPTSDKTKYGYNYLPTPHIEQVAWLYSRYRALGANLTQLHQEVFAMAQQGQPLFPDLEGITLPRTLLKRMDTGWTVSSRHGLESILTQVAYAGHVQFNGGSITVLNVNPPFIDIGDWLFAYEHLSPVDLEGHTIERGHKTVRFEQQSGRNRALLAGTRHDGRPVLDGTNGIHVYIQLAESRTNSAYHLRKRDANRKSIYGYIAQISTAKLDALVEDRVLFWIRQSQKASEHTTYDRAPYLATNSIVETNRPTTSQTMQNDLTLTNIELGKVERTIRVLNNADNTLESDLEEAYTKKARLLRRRSELEREISQADVRTAELKRAKDKLPVAVDRWAGWTLEERREFIRLITDSITLEKQADGDLRLTLVWSPLMGFMYPEDSELRAVDVALIHRQVNLPDRVTWTHDLTRDYMHDEYINGIHQS
jgi:hypothetical protein